ncbi:fibrous sheath-interacting protein 1-like [Asterias rubens]|uniref:fibrous sheath-interacting protein 1-like n=1 Tax=Asterias rubens TaxID=7604 RepID=UPI001455C266|nr:fibrous sheath-interacting protein 1-like [Asterias rubens]XP_033634833.1 fibrous sheath-interacting protein 1-like [Asterias rubens]
MDITKGNLDEISRPASNHRNHHRPGSRVSLKAPSSAGSARQGIDINNSLEILPPESPIVDQQVFDLEVVELFSSDGDSECGDNSNSDNNEDNSPPHTNSNTHNNNGSTEHPKSDKDSPEVSSARSDPLDEIQDPKVREGMRKMQQLDRILAKRVIKEKEVKRQRLKAHKDLERELQGLKPEGRDEQREVTENTCRFLALVPPPSHSEGVGIEEELLDPVFQTQPAEIDSARSAADSVNTNQGSKGGSGSQPGNNTNRSSQAEGGGEHAGDAKTKRRRKGGSKGKGQDGKHAGDNDFIQRNIDLATDAGNVIAMTDDEKKRLEELLQDVEMLVDDNEKMENTRGMNALQVSAGFGYIPDANEQQALQDIDNKLKALLPAEDFERISTTPSQERSYFYKDIDLGEKILRDAKGERLQQDRLKIIEDELTTLENRVENEIYKSPRMSQENLSDLLEQCSELSSRAATETDSILQVSPRSGRALSAVDEEDYDAQEETPRLSDDTLQRLLAEARESCLSESRLSDLTPVSSLDTQQMTARSEDSNPAYAVVSQSSIRELLRNPRATSTAVSTTGLIMDIAGRNPDAEEENDIMRRSMEEDASRVQNGIGNGYSEPAEGLGYGAYPDRPSSRNGDRKQMVTEKLWEASSAPRHSLQSPQPPASTKRVSDKQASRQAASSLSLRSFTNSTDFGASSPEQVTLRSTLRSTVPEASTSKNPRRSMESPELSTTSLRNSSMRFSLEESNSPQPPSSRQTNRSGRSRKAKQQAQSSLDSRITSSIRTDSQASTNTLVSSSDFEYEDDDEVSNQLLTRSIEVKDQRSQEAGFTKASSIQQSVTRGIARFETKEFDKERFSPPLV